MPISQVPFAGISNPVDFRNIVINGDMQIAQRATSVASITTSGYKTLDRYIFTNTSLGTWTMSQSTDVPTGQGFANSLKLDCTTADASPAAADALWLEQRFEGQNLQYLKYGTANAQYLTLSFWVKSTKTGTFIAGFIHNDNPSEGLISKSYTVNVSNTWEFKTITFPGDTANVFDNDNAFSLSLIFYLGMGSNFTSGALQTTWANYVAANRAVGQVNIADSTSNDFLITGVQLEAGEQASGFEFMPYDIDLMRCLRYFNILMSSTINQQGVVTSFFNSTRAFFRLPFLVTMRATPTISTSGFEVTYAQNNVTSTSSTFPNTFPSVQSSSVEITGAFNVTYSGHIDQSAGRITSDAEL